MTDRYVELHAASAFSFLQAASQPEKLTDRAAEIAMPALALLDHNGLYGAARFHTAAQRNNIRAHIGAEIAVSSFGPRWLPPAWLPHQCKSEPTRIPLLCESREGYQNLCQLITRFKMREETKESGAATFDDLSEYASGLVCLTGGDEGPLAAALSSGGEAAGREAVEELTRIFGRGSVYVELQRHQDREEEWRNQAALRIARSLNLPVIATNGVRHATPYEREVLDLFTAIRNHIELDQAGRLLATNSQRHLRTASEMTALFRDIPGAVENTLVLSSRLGFQLHDLGYEFPRYPVPDGDTMDSFLRKRVEEGVLRRYAPKNDRGLMERAKKQVEHELTLIAKLGFAGYFLIVWDIIRFCQQHDILVQGRGSAANSVVCYCLEITAVDPVGMDLLFERFLSESRNEWPDIDLDLPSEEKREQAIQYVYRRYGELGTAMCANVITYREKSAARETGKALGFDEETLGRLSSLAGQWEWRGNTDTMAHTFHHAGFDIRHARIAKYIELSMRIQDLPRHLGQHSGGMVICQGHLNKVVPLERASMANRHVVQWDKEDCADLGIIKVDLLGLGMMAVLHDCLELIPRHYGNKVDLAQLPQDDEVYRVVQRADTVGMFQIESRAQMASLPRNCPRKFYDLVVQVAIIRPGPIVGQMMHPYMRRRQGKEAVTYPHPSLVPVLERTLGVPLFQEQLLRIAMTVADFSGAEADELRRAVGMRRSWERMKNLEGNLRAGMTRNGIDERTQDTIVQQISSFALYGFPESHAASFALIAYASAYLKVKYLAAFTAAILNNQPMGFYSPAVLVKDAQRHGLRVKPIDVQVSEWRCTVEHESDGGLALRIGLGYARQLKRESAEALVRSRLQDGPFRSVEDVAQRVPFLNRKELKRLAEIGALNQLQGIEHRRDALWQIERAGKLEGPLLANAESLREDSEARPLQQMNVEERLVADYAGTGLTVGRHPMHYRRAELRRANILSAQDLRQRRDGEYVRVAGCIIARQRPGTAKGFIFISMEDETGICNVIVTPDLYDRDRLVVTRSKFLLVEGPLQNQDSVIHIKATRLTSLTDFALDVSSHDFH
ncbi:MULTISPECIES: error-prone DNA polymerase [Acidobacterium]|uniref:Error-prone DNA polymerase n=1 Tax=Acidobacterium capsulatum (strain ATCC 51196 / DSM 11244 / BCRC 80197 / JCM 7670 / NBRC 15755 / NCIMB 13165 / 161) TaxID=240015 RepID=C1F5L7_ACIC5|nr:MULTISPECIES: error-prone DNA polymerase [Acidobacterium]ACO34261.1 DNA polymerase III, alpha subunit [Acidobacterium capsulatum ATCC 51196]HCT60498.1 error-prone DNA polymerase [Acidobacterium sp.]